MIEVRQSDIVGKYDVYKNDKLLGISWTQEIIDDLRSYNAVDLESEIVRIMKEITPLTAEESDQLVTELIKFKRKL